jgi:hypothetical protein
LKKDKQERVEKFCRFCFNAKNPDFNTHNQFDNDGFVQCMVLLAIECQECGETGHTKRYCKMNGVPVTPVKYVNKTVPNAPKKPANKFACLIREESEDTLQTGNLALFPMLSQNQVKVTSSMMSGWTTAIKNKPVTNPVVSPALQNCEPVSDDDEGEDEIPFVPPPASTSWGDM